jgi:outer membrane beta-barrel protein
MKPALTAALLLILPLAAQGADKVEPAPAAAAAPASAPEKKNPEAVDISGLEEDYWRPNKDELEVVQNRRFQKAHKWELAAHYGIFQGQDYVDSKSFGASLTYNFTNEWFTELSYARINNSNNDFLKSVQARYNFTPDFNTEQDQEVLAVGWTPIYAKFALLGKEISHFEMYFAPGVGLTRTAAEHFSEHFTIGEKFFLTEHWILRLEWRITHFTNRVDTTQGTTSKANGGPGYVDQSTTTHNIIFGVGVMF